jgi:hypothetical protein
MGFGARLIAGLSAFNCLPGLQQTPPATSCSPLQPGSAVMVVLSETAGCGTWFANVMWPGNHSNRKVVKAAAAAVAAFAFAFAFAAAAAAAAAAMLHCCPDT